MDSRRLKDVSVSSMGDDDARMIAVATKTDSALDLRKELGIAYGDMVSDSDENAHDKDTKQIAQDERDREIRTAQVAMGWMEDEEL